MLPRAALAAMVFAATAGPALAQVIEFESGGLKYQALTHAGLGLAYAGLGEAASAIAEGQKAMAIDPSSKDPVEGPIKEERMANIYALLGDADHAS